ncbi:MAG: hypothetical protein SOX94_06325 [Prevotella sp.]|nr:hypothetical protein [Prevotella sp.]
MGLIGMLTGYDAYQNRKKAIGLKSKADNVKHEVEVTNKKKREETNKVLKEFGQVRLHALQDTVGPYLNYIKIIGHNYKEKEYEIYKKIDIKPEYIKELETIEMNAESALGVAVGSGAMAAAAMSGVPTAVTWGVTSFAAASTGTAISSLSGAAATNATLAWLGGGSLAAGGGGMAAGAAVLSGITYASMGVVALASAGLMANAIYSKKYTEATKYWEKVREYRSKMQLAWKLLDGIKQRAAELQRVTKDLRRRISCRLPLLEPLIYDYQSEDDYYVRTFQECGILVKAMSELAQVPILDVKGNVSNESGLIIDKTRKILNKEL